MAISWYPGAPVGVAAGAAAGVEFSVFAAAGAALAMRPPRPRPSRDFGAAHMRLFTSGNEERLTRVDTRGIRDLVRIDDVLSLRTRFLRDHCKCIPFLDGIADALFRVVFGKGSLDGISRRHAFGQRVD